MPVGIRGLIENLIGIPMLRSLILLYLISCGPVADVPDEMEGRVDIGDIQVSAHVPDFEEVVLHSTTTSFRRWGKYRNRAYNIRKAASLLNNVVIPSYSHFSFNQTVGPRVRTRGWKKALSILDGTLQESYGGGVCQVASTLFSSALQSGLDFPEYWSHSRYMSYVDPGFDATVADSGKDLRVFNPFPFPVRILTKVGTETLTIAFLAERRPYRVSVTVHEYNREDMGVEFRRNRSLDPGTRRIEEQGTDRVTVVRTVVYEPLVEEVIPHVWRRTLRYRGSPKIIHFN